MIDIYNKIFTSIHSKNIIQDYRNYLVEKDLINDIIKSKRHIDYNNLNNLIKVLDYIKINNGFLTKINNSELELLNMIWFVVRNNIDLVDILINNLIDITHGDGYFHCLTGRISRILNTLSGIKLSKLTVFKNINAETSKENNLDENNLDKNILTQEMLNISSKVRKDLEDLNSDEDLKICIKKKLISVYVDTNIMSLEKLEEYISDWIDYV